MTNPKRLILIGFFLVLFGFIIPWLMILDIVKTSFWLSFLTYGSQVSGLILGIMGAAMMAGTRKKE